MSEKTSQIKVEDDKQMLARYTTVPPETLKSIMKLGPVYRGAMREISTKLENIDHEFETLYDHNPIHHMQCRIKSPKSIVNKLERKNIPVTAENGIKEILDIAGVRVVCNYTDDVFVLAELLIGQDDIELVSIRNYISRPKKNGYRSLHLIVKVPVFLSTGSEMVPVEVQIRTIAMDMWASLEHEIRYKSETEIPLETVNRLKVCANVLAETDREMQAIYKKCLEGRKTAENIQPEADYLRA